VVLVCGACGNETGAPGEKQVVSAQARLRDDVRRGVEAAFPGAKFVAKDDLTLAVKRADGTDLEIRLDNLWLDIEGAAPADRQAMIDQFVRMVTSSPPPAAEGDRETKLKALVPLVRGEAHLEEMRQMSPPASRPLVADLHVVYGYDGDGSVTMMPERDVEELALDAEELHRRAVENLSAVIGDQVELHTVGPMWVLTCGGTYEASLLVADKLWTKLKGQVKGDIIAGCPTRDVLLFADEADPASVTALRKAVEEAYAKGGRTISKRLLRRTAGGWTPVED